MAQQLAVEHKQTLSGERLLTTHSFLISASQFVSTVSFFSARIADTSIHWDSLCIAVQHEHGSGRNACIRTPPSHCLQRAAIARPNDGGICDSVDGLGEQGLSAIVPDMLCGPPATGWCLDFGES